MKEFEEQNSEKNVKKEISLEKKRMRKL